MVLLSLSECRKKNDPSPEAQLPPATQEGRNAFGCLLNGQAWTPSGSNGFNGSPNYSVSYDPTYKGGTLNISTYRYFGEGTRNKQGIVLGSDNLSKSGTYSLDIPNHQEAGFYDRQTGCEFLQGENHYRRGTLTITRLDLAARVISGTFEFTLYKPGCDTIKVTQGRFDKKL